MVWIILGVQDNQCPTFSSLSYIVISNGIITLPAQFSLSREAVSAILRLHKKTFVSVSTTQLICESPRCGGYRGKLQLDASDKYKVVHKRFEGTTTRPLRSLSSSSSFDNTRRLGFWPILRHRMLPLSKDISSDGVILFFIILIYSSLSC